jgi:hypothetical protein
MIDFGSSSWRELDRLLRQKLETLREKNDNPLDLSETADIRGRIAVIKELLALPRTSAALVRMTEHSEVDDY